MLTCSWARPSSDARLSTIYTWSTSNDKYRVLPVEEFLTLILHTSPDWRESNQHAIGIVLWDNIFGEELDAYKKPMKTEREQYQSLVRMLNRIVNLLAKFHPNSLRITFTRNLNDPTMVLGSAMSWKLEAAGGDQVEATMEKSDAPHCAEVFTFVDFKLICHSHSDSVLDPPVAQSESVSRSEPSGTTPGSSMSGLSQTGPHADGSVPTAS